MLRKFYTTILAITCLSILTSCSKTMLGLYGMKDTKAVDDNTILQYSKMYDIPLEDNYELDTSYSTYLFSLDTTYYKAQIKNHYQPLQALYFAKSKQLQSFQINCYAGGFPNLKWDRDEILTTFPPKQQAPVDNLLSLDTQLKFLRPLQQTSKLSVDDYDYIVIIYWNRFMGRQSKRLIHFIQDNSKLSADKKVKIIYANNDNIFAKTDIQK
jgi:hypothetical protein